MTTYPTEVRPTLFGIVLALYPSDLRAHLEIQRAPDSSGSPDTGSAEVIGVAAPGQRTFTDLRSSGTWHYRVRHVRSGATSSSWTDWAAATPKPIPAELPQLPEVGGWIIKQGRLESTDGAIVLDAPNENIRIGAATSPTSGIGIFQGLDGVNADKYDWRVGDPNGQQAWWDHSEGVFKYTGLLEANGIRYGPLHIDASDRATTATATEQTMATITVPADVMGSSGGWHLVCHLEVTAGNVASTTVRVRLDGNLLVTTTQAASALPRQVRIELHHSNNASTSAQKGQWAVAKSGNVQELGTSSSSVDTTADSDITITVDLGDSADGATLRYSFVQLVAPGA